MITLTIVSLTLANNENKEFLNVSPDPYVYSEGIDPEHLSLGKEDEPLEVNLPAEIDVEDTFALNNLQPDGQKNDIDNDASEND